jgi:hypothetical protein
MWPYGMAPYGASPYGAGGVASHGTTVMLRNIPNRYTRDMLVDRLNTDYEGQFDFVYLPIDFNSKCNVGYAFINFRLPVSAQMFIARFHGAKTKNCLPGFSSSKVCEVSYARVQGRDANMDNLRDDKFIEKLNERPEWQPLFFDGNGKEIPFAKMLNSVGKSRRKKGGGSSPFDGAGKGGGFGTPYGGAMYPSFGMAPQVPGQPQVPGSQPMPSLPSSFSSVLKDATSSTMLMLRGVPVEYTPQGVLEVLSGSYKGKFDFLYVPKNPKGDGNRGFAFINFRSNEWAHSFTDGVKGVSVNELFNKTSEKASESAEDAVDSDGEKISDLCDVVGAEVRRVEKSIERAQAETPSKKEGGLTEWAAWQPLLFDKAGKPKAFPILQSSIGSSSTPTTPNARGLQAAQMMQMQTFQRMQAMQYMQAVSVASYQAGLQNQMMQQMQEYQMNLAAGLDAEQGTEGEAAEEGEGEGVDWSPDVHGAGSEWYGMSEHGSTDAWGGADWSGAMGSGCGWDETHHDVVHHSYHDGWGTMAPQEDYDAESGAASNWYV